MLQRVDQQIPADLGPHLIVDKYATHKYSVVLWGLRQHPRLHRPFTLTSRLQLTLIALWVWDLTYKRLRRGLLQSEQPLIQAICSWIEAGSG